MADIFISYAREDIAKAHAIAKELEARGWSVFWDRRIPHGQDFNVYLQNQLDRARCIVVLWSHSSVASKYVRDEANEGREDGRLVPVLVEDVRPPLGFRQFQSADLVGWPGDAPNEDFGRLLTSIESIVPQPAQSAREQVLKFAREYVATRREPFSDDRTQKLEVIFTKMKGLALLAYPLLKELTRSVPRNTGEDPGAGERLAAVALLDARPSPDYVNWLAERFGREQPFVEYHAAVALLNAAREFRTTHAEIMRDVIRRALRTLSPDSDRYRTLNDALVELEPR